MRRCWCLCEMKGGSDEESYFDVGRLYEASGIKLSEAASAQISR